MIFGRKPKIIRLNGKYFLGHAMFQAFCSCFALCNIHSAPAAAAGPPGRGNARRRAQAARTAGAARFF
jgi:hypothetical protein